MYIVAFCSMDLSIVVSSYGRFEHVKTLVETCRVSLKAISYEIVAVTSDPVLSPKNKWLALQPNVKLIAVGDRASGAPRQKSLYHYENLGLKAAQGNWILINNDDTTISEDLEVAFLKNRDSADILVIPTEIDDKSLGKRAPIVGTVKKGETSTPVYLLDFAFFKREVFDRIGFADENLDWFGRGLDMSLACVFFAPDLRIKPLASGSLTHNLSEENRKPPHYAIDFRYLDEKWNAIAQTKGYVIELFDWGRGLRLPGFYLKVIWPALRDLRDVSRTLFTKARCRNKF